MLFTPLATNGDFPSKLLLVTGKGGTGKTLASAILAQELAAKGKRVLLVESNPHCQIAPLFSTQDKLHQLLHAADKIDYINLDPRQCLADYFIKVLNKPALYKLLLSVGRLQTLIYAIPGVFETAILSWIFYAADKKLLGHDYDHVIFDSYATGHFIAMMTTPEAVLKASLSGVLVKDIEDLKAYLFNPEKTSVVLLALAEKLVVDETAELLALLGGELKLHIGLLIVNRLLAGIQEVHSASGMEHVFAYLRRQRTRQQESMVQLCANIRLLKTHNLQKSMIVAGMSEQGFVAEPLAAEAKSWLVKGEALRDYFPGIES